jgi:hypothetical protein
VGFVEVEVVGFVVEEVLAVVEGLVVEAGVVVVPGICAKSFDYLKL